MRIFTSLTTITNSYWIARSVQLIIITTSTTSSVAYVIRILIWSPRTRVRLKSSFKKIDSALVTRLPNIFQRNVRAAKTQQKYSNTTTFYGGRFVRRVRLGLTRALVRFGSWMPQTSRRCESRWGFSAMPRKKIARATTVRARIIAANTASKANFLRTWTITSSTKIFHCHRPWIWARSSSSLFSSARFSTSAAIATI